ncbi:histidine phosphatase family protein [Chitinophaga nivalis]|uniref:Histidine phosphatase family protein n=1 Tax=Chitinophaga nivalis TaxID=2991709 RepID=A0ABT3IRI1_9BACT|nr:histidine phosphatase family protein [Chitinophaga nivalis]MCW3463722.1 histidine phosphatase family protein [Chitinophaga nivalis]MCW3486588.1 histidine phosphatase family protein [Chitinophaga nivalis]
MRLMPILFSLFLLAGCQPKPPARIPVPVAEDSTFLTGTFFLVRHAENNPGPDSTLTLAGQQRAGALYHLLKDSAIAKIYTTRYIRSIQTADSLRIRLHLDTCIYQADTTGESLLYEMIRRGDWGKRILVVGHSNTLVPIMHSLRATPHADTIGEREYDRLFIVYKTKAASTVKEHCY